MRQLVKEPNGETPFEETRTPPALLQQLEKGITNPVDQIIPAARPKS
jgi:hypothetical protein